MTHKTFLSTVALVIIAVLSICGSATAQDANVQEGEAPPRDSSEHAHTQSGSSCQPSQTLPAGEPAASLLGETIRPAILTYDLAMDFGTGAMQLEGTRHVEPATLDGQDVWRVVDVSTMHGSTAADTVEVDRRTLLPERRAASGRGTIRLDFQPDRVTGTVTQGPGAEQTVDAALEAPAFGGETALEIVIAALPLQTGYATKLRTFVPYTQSSRVMNLCVTSSTTITVSGSDREALVVEMAPQHGTGRERSVLHVFAEPPHYVIKGEYHLPESAGAGTIVMTLQEASVVRDALDASSSR